VTAVIRTGRRLATAALLATLAALAVMPASSSAAGAGVRFGGCLSGDSDVNSCQLIPTAQPYGQFSGLGAPDGIKVSSDGRFAYVLSNRDSAVATFDRDPASGSLSFSSCVTGDDFNGSCVKLPGASANAVHAPIGSPSSMTLTPDGRALYVASGNFTGNEVAHFDRDPTTGALTYRNCVSGNLGTGTGTGVCAPISTATPSPNGEGGFNSGLSAPSGITSSADGRFLFVTSSDDAVTTMARDAAGNLSFASCITDNPKLAICSKMNATKYAALQEARAPTLSANGADLYVAGLESSAISAFRIDPSSGALREINCLTAAPVKSCTQAESDKGFGALAAPVRLAPSPDGRFVYSLSKYGGAIGTLKRRPSGALKLAGCITGARDRPRLCRPVRRATPNGYNSGLAGMVDLGISGRSIYAIARTDAAIDRFKRNPKTGALAYKGCSSASLKVTRRHACAKLSDATKGGVGSGLYKPSALAITASQLYVTAGRDSAVTRLAP